MIVRIIVIIFVLVYVCVQMYVRGCISHCLTVRAILFTIYLIFKSKLAA